MTIRKPTIKVVPGQIWADKDPRRAGRTVQILEVDGIRFAMVKSPSDVGRLSRVEYDEHGLRGYRLASQPEEN